MLPHLPAGRLRSMATVPSPAVGAGDVRGAPDPSDPKVLAAQIIAAGNKARGET